MSVCVFPQPVYSLRVTEWNWWSAKIKKAAEGDNIVARQKAHTRIMPIWKTALGAIHVCAYAAQKYKFPPLGRLNVSSRYGSVCVCVCVCECSFCTETTKPTTTFVASWSKNFNLLFACIGFKDWNTSFVF